MSRKVIIGLMVICLLIAVVPLMAIKDSEFCGADGAAEELVAEIDPGYTVWAESILEPPGGETESLLFCLQAALGAGIFGYSIGMLKERTKSKRNQTTIR